MKKYLVINENDHIAKVDAFDTIETANRFAFHDWEYLDYHDRIDTHIYVGSVEDTDEYYNSEILRAVEDGNPMLWSAFDRLNDEPDGFDSDNVLNDFKIKPYPANYTITIYSDKDTQYSFNFNLDEVFPADENEAHNFAYEDLEQMFVYDDDLGNVPSSMIDRGLKCEILDALEKLYCDRIK